MSETSSERNEQRRKLLKKAAVAPAIFVLPVGTALANSSLNACIYRGVDGVNIGESINPHVAPDANSPIPLDKWVRRYSPGDGSSPIPGNYLVYDPDTQLPVAYASCWNSCNPNGERAEQGTNLLSRHLIP